MFADGCKHNGGGRNRGNSVKPADDKSMKTTPTLSPHPIPSHSNYPSLTLSQSMTAIYSLLPFTQSLFFRLSLFLSITLFFYSDNLTVSFSHSTFNSSLYRFTHCTHKKSVSHSILLVLLSLFLSLSFSFPYLPLPFSTFFTSILMALFDPVPNTPPTQCLSLTTLEIFNNYYLEINTMQLFTIDRKLSYHYIYMYVYMY